MKNPTIYEQITEKYQKLCLENLAKFVAIDSVYDEASKDETSPFGKGVSNALRFVENLAREDGFEVTNYDNMIVEIICGKGDKDICIMAHADVVPVGSGWPHDPFEMQNNNGLLTGRGVADDKGPMLASYYALKALRDNNMLGNYKVRLLVGGNEESGSLCMEHYFQTLKKPAPTLGFSPDSSFPLIYAEKGIAGFKVNVKLSIPNVFSIEGGVASNSVIDRCKIVMNKDVAFISYLADNDYDITIENDGEVITFNGVAAHGSIPWEGKNAAIAAFKALADFYNVEELKEVIKKYGPVKAEGVGLACYSEDMFDNSLNVGIVEYKNNNLEIIINFRHVQTITTEEAVKRFIENSKPFACELCGISPLLYFPKDSVLVSTLLKSYRDETGDMREPLTAGGGTYAKETSNVVAFGMEFPGRDLKMHGVGENLLVEELNKGMAIYARAIADLGKAIDENKI